MKKITKKIVSIKIVCLCLLLTFKGCNLDEVFYRQVTPETYFTSRQTVLAFKNRPFTHFRWFMEHCRWRVQELTTDAFILPTRGIHWFDGGHFQRLHRHEWTVNENSIWEVWRGGTMGVAITLQTKEILQEVDYLALGLTLEDRASHLMQLQTLKAYFYLHLLDAFGGVPLFTATTESPKPRSTARETFNHIEQLLLDAIPHLPVKTVLGAPEEGVIHRAAAATWLARLYFNAMVYIGEDRFADAARISQDILNGVYGNYALGATWYCVHSFTNNRSPELILSTPSQQGRLHFNWFQGDFYHYNVRDALDQVGVPGSGSNNGISLSPSRDLLGNLLPYRLGNPFETFHDLDVRKRPFLFLGDGRHEGMFLVGAQVNPRTGVPALGTVEYLGEPLYLVDKVGRFSQVGVVNAEGETPFPTIESLRSSIADGEENTGIRLMKVPQPNAAEQIIRWNAHNPVIRLAEIYLMLAECRMRAGDLEGAATLINTVRARNFEGADPDPVTAANLNSYRMLDEWLIEFLGEGRRRTDLIRWGKFVTGPWWDFPGHGNTYRNLFPIPLRAIAGSGGLLEQNPGYE